jgi:streptogramin lyase
MKVSRYALLLISTLQAAPQASAPPAVAEQTAQLRALIGNSPRLTLQKTVVSIQPPSPDWTTDYVSSVAVSRDGTFYVLHRNLNVDPVLAVDKTGKIVRSWGRGLYTNPHSIRVDPEGNIWTVDSGSSVVLKFSPAGTQLLRFEIGEVPQARGASRGAIDIAFASGGRLFIADGYRNARVLEYDKQGKRIRAWGSAGTGPGEFTLPHGIAIHDKIIYVADRQNGRIQHFDLEGRYLGEWTHLGKTFSITAGPDASLWIGTHPRDVINEAPGWIVKIDRKTGKVLGYLDSPGLHSVCTTVSGDVVSDPGRGNSNKLQWFRHSK